MKICFYSPYFPDHFGGGEKHLLDVAVAASAQHDCSIAISSRSTSPLSLEKIQEKYAKFYGSSLDQIKFIVTPLGSSASALTKLSWTKDWDGLYYVTDGSLFFSLAQHNFLHIQTPLLLDKSRLSERLKLKNWQYKNTNSYFTKDCIERSWKTHVSQVLHPTIDCAELAADPAGKKKRILAVGRFFRQLHTKRQDVLVTAFRALREAEPALLKGWKLQFVGSVEDQSYLAEVQAAAKGLPVEFYIDCSHEQLRSLYKEARIFWHATGFERDERTEPERVEHFGISTAEAMAAGCIPIVVPKGGQKEVLGKQFMQFGWSSVEECVTNTTQVIRHSERWKSLAQDATAQVEQFDTAHFQREVHTLFDV